MADGDVAEELWALQHAAYRDEAALIGAADLPPLRDTVASLQACGERFVGWIADNGDLAGAVSTEAGDGGSIVICRMMVHPEYRRQGIARRLLSAVLDPGTGKPGRFEVTAEARNTPAIGLYEALGFHRAGSFRPAPGIEMIRFVR